MMGAMVQGVAFGKTLFENRVEKSLARGTPWWLGTFVGDTIPGYDIEKLQTAEWLTIPMIFGAYIHENTVDSPWRKIGSHVHKRYMTECVASVNFRVTLFYGELREQKDRTSINYGPGMGVLHYGDCVTKAKQLSNGAVLEIGSPSKEEIEKLKRLLNKVPS